MINNFNSHPWNNKDVFELIDDKYLSELGINIGNLEIDLVKKLEKASKTLKKFCDEKKWKPPLIRKNEQLPITFINIPKDLELLQHGTTITCSGMIREVTPVVGCQLNCQYCLAAAQEGIQTEVLVYKDYAKWLREVFRKNRVKNEKSKGVMYYFSAKTEAFAPHLIESGIVEEILLAFYDHVKEEEKRLGICLDTLMIVTKAGIQDLKIKGPKGYTLIDLFKLIPNNIQLSISLAYLNNDEDLREALEPGARGEKDRLEFVKELQKNNILVQGALIQPGFHFFVPDQIFWRKLKSAGISRVAFDLFTTTPENLALIGQIIGWFYPEKRKDVYEGYLEPSDFRKGNRKGLKIERQKEYYLQSVQSAKEGGMEFAVYCPFVQYSVGLPKLLYLEPENGGTGGCMAHLISPTPQLINKLRKKQPFSSK